MRVVRVRNVSEAWARLSETLQGALPEQTRAGAALVCPEPVTTVYEHPRERVLFCPARDANPFFHLVEALWMLAGRQDARVLSRYVRDFGERFAEDDGTIHGAYGHRWRHALGYDQLGAAVAKLALNPRDRQVVIQMWDGAARELTHVTYGSNDLRGSWRDRPCNTHAYVRVRESRETRGGDLCIDRVLDLTVLCRSNDAIWGAYGANAVHFSVLQEYLAARLGAEVGTLYQVSNNFHAYVDVWDKVRPSDEQASAAEEVTLGCVPMFDAPQWIDKDLQTFFDWHEGMWSGGAERRHVYHNQWFQHTAERLARVWYSYRGVRSISAAEVGALAVGCPAWRVACLEWLERRAAR